VAASGVPGNAGGKSGSRPLMRRHRGLPRPRDHAEGHADDANGFADDGSGEHGRIWTARRFQSRRMTLVSFDFPHEQPYAARMAVREAAHEAMELAGPDS
jgi:hypothetical protein